MNKINERIKSLEKQAKKVITKLLDHNNKIRVVVVRQDKEVNEL